MKTIDSHPTITAQAEAIAAEVQGSTVKAAVDPALLAAIIQILLSLFKSFGSCGQPPAAVQQTLAHPRLVHRLAYKRTIRYHLPDQPTLWLPIYDASTQVAQRQDVPSVTKMLSEVGGP